jgi:xanthine/CO dehydrogenase XdhC/CoxF family maturation factor
MLDEFYSDDPKDYIESRLRGPVGLNIGAVTPESIALAIVSEIHARLAGREAPGSGLEMRKSSE